MLSAWTTAATDEFITGKTDRSLRPAGKHLSGEVSIRDAFIFDRSVSRPGNIHAAIVRQWQFQAGSARRPYTRYTRSPVWDIQTPSSQWHGQPCVALDSASGAPRRIRLRCGLPTSAAALTDGRIGSAHRPPLRKAHTPAANCALGSQ